METADRQISPYSDPELRAAASKLSFPSWGNIRVERTREYLDLAMDKHELSLEAARLLLARLNSGRQPNPDQLGHG